MYLIDFFLAYATVALLMLANMFTTLG